MRLILVLALVAALAACKLTPEQQAQVQQTLIVACNVDGVVVPLARPVVATLGQAGTSLASADLLVHPQVVAVCKALGGAPASVTPAGSPQLVSTPDNKQAGS